MRSRLAFAPGFRSRARRALRRGAQAARTPFPGVALVSLFALIAILSALPASAAGNVPAPSRGSASEFLPLLALQQAQLTALDGSSSDWFGYSVAVAGDSAVVGAPMHSVAANSAQGAAYFFVRSGTTWSQQAQLTATDGAADDNFGSAVALSGDTALVGSPYHGASAQGAAYVFVRSGTTWSPQAQLTASDGAADDNFGSAVALSGDTALVGSPSHTSDQGAAYVFVRSGTTWSQQAPLTATDGAADDNFGSAVALSGDTALVGSPYHGASGQGAAYVFVRSGTTWSPQAELTASAGAAGDLFGSSVALSGDTALIGSPRGDVGANADQGSAYVFTRSGASWSQQTQLIAADGAANDRFGWVALSGNVALVGAAGHHVSAVLQGTAYVFARSGSIWGQQAQLTGGAVGSSFGLAVALSGDTALVGANAAGGARRAVKGPASTGAAARSGPGSVYVYLLDVDVVAPTTTASLHPSPNPAGWNNAAVTVTLKASDVGSGVASTEYRVQGAATWTPYSSPFPVSIQGSSVWEYRSIDKVGNVETPKAVTIKLDTGKPAVTTYAVQVKKGKKVKLAFKVGDALPGCGQATVTLKIYKGAKLKKTIKVGSSACNVKQTCTWRCTLVKGNYTIKGYATDIAGNVQRKVGSARLKVK